MRVLIFGAGPLGSLYAHLLHQSGVELSLLARGARYDWLSENGLVLVNEITGEASQSDVTLVDNVAADDHYDLAIVFVRKNKLPPIFEALAACPGIQNILFMGNNALGFDEYLEQLPREKVFFGFPGAGGGIREQVVHYADRESEKGRRRALTIGELDGRQSERLYQIRGLFEAAGVPVEVSPGIDGWLKYHVALVSPLVGALYRHHCDNRKLAQDKDTLRVLVRAAKEGARVLDKLGFKASEPSQFKLMRWLPEFMKIFGLRKMLESKFAEVAFAMHAESARDEMDELAREFEMLIEKSALDTPNIHALSDRSVCK